MVRKTKEIVVAKFGQDESHPDRRSERGWIDISVPLRNAMVHWPGDPPIRIERVKDIEEGAGSTLSMLSMGSHTGTHMDAPLHFIAQGAGIDEMPLDTSVGLARLIEIQDPESIKPEELQRHGIRRGQRILIKTRNSSRAWRSNAFVKDFVYMSKEAARFLAETKIRLVGFDYLSIGGFRIEGVETHHILLEGGIWIVEGLDLSRVRPGEYQLICLPLKLERGDGAPARAIVKPV